MEDIGVIDMDAIYKTIDAPVATEETPPPQRKRGRPRKEVATVSAEELEAIQVKEREKIRKRADEAMLQLVDMLGSAPEIFDMKIWIDRNKNRGDLLGRIVMANGVKDRFGNSEWDKSFYVPDIERAVAAFLGVTIAQVHELNSPWEWPPEYAAPWYETGGMEHVINWVRAWACKVGIWTKQECTGKDL